MIDNDLFIIGEDGINYQISLYSFDSRQEIMIDRWAGYNYECWNGSHVRLIENGQVRWQQEDELGAYQTPPDVRRDIDSLLKMKAFW